MRSRSDNSELRVTPDVHSCTAYVPAKRLAPEPNNDVSRPPALTTTHHDTSNNGQ